MNRTHAPVEEIRAALAALPAPPWHWFGPSTLTTDGRGGQALVFPDHETGELLFRGTVTADQDGPGMYTAHDLAQAGMPNPVADWLAHSGTYAAMLLADIEHQSAPSDVAPVRAGIFGEIDAERARQIDTWGQQHRADDTGGTTLRIEADHARTACQRAEQHIPGGAGWRLVLAEEIGEAFAESDPQHLRKELIQCAAVIVAWLEDLASRTA